MFASVTFFFSSSSFMLTHTRSHTHMQPKAHRAVAHVAHLMGILMSVSTVVDIFPPFWFDFVLMESFQYFEKVMVFIWVDRSDKDVQYLSEKGRVRSTIKAVTVQAGSSWRIATAISKSTAIVVALCKTIKWPATTNVGYR